MTALAFSPNGVQRSSLSDTIQEWFGNDSIIRPNFKYPSTNIIEHDDKYVIELSVPGYTKDTLDIKVERNQLTISTTQSNQETVENDSYKMREFSQMSFNKSFHLSEDIDTESISAKCDNGILAVTLPKKDEAKPQPPKKISIK